VWTHGTITPLERPEEYGARELLTAEEDAALNHLSDSRAEREGLFKPWWDRGISIGGTSQIRVTDASHPDFLRLSDELLPWRLNVGKESTEVAFLRWVPKICLYGYVVSSIAQWPLRRVNTTTMCKLRSHQAMWQYYKNRFTRHESFHWTTDQSSARRWTNGSVFHAAIGKTTRWLLKRQIFETTPNISAQIRTDMLKNV